MFTGPAITITAPVRTREDFYAALPSKVPVRNLDALADALRDFRPQSISVSQWDLGPIDTVAIAQVLKDLGVTLYLTTNRTGKDDAE